MSNPMFPANSAELKAFAQVLKVTCADSQGVYEQEKSRRRDPRLSDIAGAASRECQITSFKQIKTQCNDLFEDFLSCNASNQYDNVRKCKDIRVSLQKCAAEKKVGEFGQSFMKL